MKQNGEACWPVSVVDVGISLGEPPQAALPATITGTDSTSYACYDCTTSSFRR